MMETLNIEVVYATPEKETLIRLKLAQGSSVSDALAQSKIFERYPDLSRERVGIYGRLVGLDTQLNDGDRIELYRPITADPRTARRSRPGA